MFKNDLYDNGKGSLLLSQVSVIAQFEFYTSPHFPVVCFVLSYGLERHKQVWREYCKKIKKNRHLKTLLSLKERRIYSIIGHKTWCRDQRKILDRKGFYCFFQLQLELFLLRCATIGRHIIIRLAPKKVLSCFLCFCQNASQFKFKEKLKTTLPQTLGQPEAQGSHPQKTVLFVTIDLNL